MWVDSDKKIVAVDTETTGLDPYKGARVFCIAWFDSDGKSGFKLKEDKNFVGCIKRLFRNYYKVIFHNAKFDMKMLEYEVDIKESWKKKVECTLIMSHIYNSSMSNSLRNMVSVLLQVNLSDKDEVDKWIRKNKRQINKIKKKTGGVCNFSDAPEELVKRRCLWDVENTLYIYVMLKAYLRKNTNLQKLYETERKLMWAVLEMECNGIQVDRQRVLYLQKKAAYSEKKAQEKLNEIAGTEVNVNSGKQLEVLWGSTGQAVIMGEPTKTGKINPKFDHATMLSYIPKHLIKIATRSYEENWGWYKLESELKITNWTESTPIIVLKIRQLKKMISTYYNNILEGSKLDGRLHCGFNQTGTVTGRFSCSGGLQTMPRVAGPRECFVARPGYKLWFFDYSQIEMRLFAFFAQCETMQRAIEHDIHRSVASQIYRKGEASITPEERFRAKAINFGIIYGAGPRKIAETLTRDGIQTSVSEATELVGNYHTVYPEVRQLMGTLIENVRNHRPEEMGSMSNGYGRSYFIDDNKAYVVLNYLCQGTAADIIKSAMVSIWEILQEKGSRTRLIAQVHDELIYEIPGRERKWVPKIIKRKMVEAGEAIGMSTKVDVASGFRWSNKEKKNVD